MNGYQHHVSGVFTHRKDAEHALSSLSAQGLRKEQLRIFKARVHTKPDTQKQSRRKSVLQDVLVDGVFGALAGLALGVFGLLGLFWIDPVMFQANLWVVMTMLLGWGGSLGALIGTIFGATKGAGNKTGWLANRFKTLITQKNVVLLVKTETEGQTHIARKVFQSSPGFFTDTNVSNYR